jgi:hypothetical protein
MNGGRFLVSVMEKVLLFWGGHGIIRKYYRCDAPEEERK